MQSLADAIQNFASTQLVLLAIPLAVAGLIIVGLGFLLGFRPVLEWCKVHILHIIGGLALIYLAGNLVTSFIATLGF